eukprot:4638476-Ditylum_brightwellii.AAC.1
MEAILSTTQGQVLATTFARKNILKLDFDPLYYFCCKENKTILHVVNTYKMLAGTAYIKRHNTIYRYLHWCLMQDFGNQSTPAGASISPNMHCASLTRSLSPMT